MKEQLLVVDGIGEGTVLHSTMDAEDMLNGKRRRDRATVKGIYRRGRMGSGPYITIKQGVGQHSM